MSHYDSEEPRVTVMSEENYSPCDFIPKPCKEDWHAMSGDEQRRHCEKCDTHVHDLTGMSSEEILAMRRKNGGKLCGAFRLGRPIALGSGIASLALASCSEQKGKEVVLPGIVCEPPPKEEPIDRKHTTKSPSKPKSEQRASAKPFENKKPNKLGPDVVPMLLGDICLPREPKDLPPKADQKGDVGPV